MHFFRPPIHHNNADANPSHPDRCRTHGPSLLTPPFTLLGTPAGGLVTFAVNRQQFKHQLQVLLQRYKTEFMAEFMAEEMARDLLNRQSFTDRSFDVLQKHLGGFDADGLRKILVRAGAMQTSRDDGASWWCLLSRTGERIEKPHGRDWGILPVMP